MSLGNFLIQMFAHKTKNDPLTWGVNPIVYNTNSSDSMPSPKFL